MALTLVVIEASLVTVNTTGICSGVLPAADGVTVMVAVYMPGGSAVDCTETVNGAAVLPEFGITSQSALPLLEIA